MCDSRRPLSPVRGSLPLFAGLILLAAPPSRVEAGATDGRSAGTPSPASSLDHLATRFVCLDPARASRALGTLEARGALDPTERDELARLLAGEVPPEACGEVSACVLAAEVLDRALAGDPAAELGPGLPSGWSSAASLLELRATCRPSRVVEDILEGDLLWRAGLPTEAAASWRLAAQLDAAQGGHWAPVLGTRAACVGDPRASGPCPPYLREGVVLPTSADPTELTCLRRGDPSCAALTRCTDATRAFLEADLEVDPLPDPRAYGLAMKERNERALEALDVAHRPCMRPPTSGAPPQEQALAAAAVALSTARLGEVMARAPGPPGIGEIEQASWDQVMGDFAEPWRAGADRVWVEAAALPTELAPAFAAAGRRRANELTVRNQGYEAARLATNLRIWGRVTGSSPGDRAPRLQALAGELRTALDTRRGCLPAAVVTSGENALSASEAALTTGDASDRSEALVTVARALLEVEAVLVCVGG